MKKWMGLIVMVVVMTFVMPVAVQASAGKSRVHFAQETIMVQCVKGIPVSLSCTLHDKCSEDGHYDVIGRYRSSNKQIATVSKTGTIHFTGKPGTVTITIKYNKKTYKMKVTVIAPDLPISTTYGAIANRKCYAFGVGDTWVNGRRLGIIKRRL